MRILDTDVTDDAATHHDRPRTPNGVPSLSTVAREEKSNVKTERSSVS